MDDLEKLISIHFAKKREELNKESAYLFDRFIERLDGGEFRAAEKKDGKWEVNPWVKEGILLGFKLGNIIDCSIDQRFQFQDKHTYPLKNIKASAQSVRLVPGGSSVRRGAFLGKSVTLMPPMYINVGAYVDDGAMVDSHVLVGSCAQIGKRVHLSAGCQIGGVLEPVGAMPVIIEDDVLVGGNCGIYDGTLVQSGAVIGAGTIITGSVPIFDLVKKEVYRKGHDISLVIPENAVVVPGTRAVSGEFARQHGLHIACPVIIKYRDQSTDAATSLEELLR